MAPVCVSAQSHLTLCYPRDCSPPGSSVRRFSRQEYWSGLPLSLPGDLPNPGIEPTSLCLLHWQADSLPLAPPGKPTLEKSTLESPFSWPHAFRLAPILLPKSKEVWLILKIGLFFFFFIFNGISSVGVNYNLPLVQIRERKSACNLHTKNWNTNEDKSLFSVEWSTKILPFTLTWLRKKLKQTKKKKRGNRNFIWKVP